MFQQLQNQLILFESNVNNAYRRSIHHTLDRCLVFLLCSYIFGIIGGILSIALLKFPWSVIAFTLCILPMVIATVSIMPMTCFEQLKEEPYRLPESAPRCIVRPCRSCAHFIHQVCYRIFFYREYKRMNQIFVHDDYQTLNNLLDQVDEEIPFEKKQLDFFTYQNQHQKIREYVQNLEEKHNQFFKCIPFLLQEVIGFPHDLDAIILSFLEMK